ncbi:hypothetical protein [Salinibacterium sp.]|uniref:hypothetical protein n=1 Tax=Salinibacterium sp. TaxID=1915057 RepID=UPI00286BCF98|nr:hypothetical protein [Salinibacterium sp.]
MTRRSQHTPGRHVAGATRYGHIPTSFRRSAPAAVVGVVCAGMLGTALFTLSIAPSASALEIADFGSGGYGGGGGGGFDFGGSDFGGSFADGAATDFGASEFSDLGSLGGESFTDGVNSPVEVGLDGPVTSGPLVVVSVDGVPVDGAATQTQPSLGFPDPSGLDTSFVGQGIEGGDNISGGIKAEGVFWGQGVRGYIGTDGVSYSVVDAYGFGANASVSTAAAMPPSGTTFEARATFEVGIIKGNVTGAIGPDSPTVSNVGVTLNAGGFRAGLSGDLQNAPTASAGYAPSLGLGASFWAGQVDTNSTTWTEIGSKIPDSASLPNLGFPDPSGLDTSFVGEGAAPESSIELSEPFRIEISGVATPEEAAASEARAAETGIGLATPVDYSAPAETLAPVTKTAVETTPSFESAPGDASGFWSAGYESSGE